MKRTERNKIIEKYEIINKPIITKKELCILLERSIPSVNKILYAYEKKQGKNIYNRNIPTKSILDFLGIDTTIIINSYSMINK